MADTTQDMQLRFRYPTELRLRRFTLDSSAAQTVFRGVPMVIDQSADTANLRIFNAALTLATGDVFVGLASEGCKVALGDAEADREIEVITAGEVGIKSAVFALADMGAAVYFDDSGTLSKTATGNLKVGILRDVVDGYCYIEINPGAEPLIQ